MSLAVRAWSRSCHQPRTGGKYPCAGPGVTVSCVSFDVPYPATPGDLPSSLPPPRPAALPARGGSAMPGPSPYRVIFAAPGAKAFSVAGFIGRMTVAMTSIGVVTMVSQLTGRYGLAGALAATLAL